MGRGRDEFWDHAEKLNGGRRFRCNYCKTEYSGGATRIKYHLSQHKGGDIQICPKVPEDVRLAAVRAIDPDDHQGSLISKNKTKKKKSIASCSSSQTEMVHKRVLLHPDADDTKLAKFLILHSIPLAVAEAPLFGEFVKCVTDFGSNHQQSIARATLERHLEYDVPKQVEEYTKHAEESLLQTGCTLIFNPDYDLLYASTSKGLLFKGTLQCEYKKWLYSVIPSLGPNNILQYLLIDDYDIEYYEEIGQEVLIEYPWLCVTSCATPQILYFFKNISCEQCSFTTCATLVFIYMKKNHSILKSDLCSQSSSIVGLAYDLIERHGSVSDFVVGFLRLKSLLEYQDILQALPLPVQLSNRSKDSRFFYFAIKQEKFWKRGKEVVQALHPLFEAFCLLLTNPTTVGYLYQLIERAKNLIEGLENCCLWECMRTNFDQMYRRTIGPIHAVAALLNPAYLWSEDYNEKNTDMKEGIDFVLENIVQVEERNDFMSQLVTYRSKDTKLFTLSARTMSNTSHPGVWWEYCGHCVPVLQKYALKIVNQPCSSFFTDDDMDSIAIDDSVDQLKTKIMMMNKFVKPKAHPAETTKLVDQLAALLDMEPYCSNYDHFLEKLLPGLDDDDEVFWDYLHDPSHPFLNKYYNSIFNF